jgi:MFS family permease
VIRNRPADLGLYPDAASEPVPTPSGAGGGSWSFGRLVGNRNFWIITVVVGTIFGVVTGLITNLPPLVAEAGVEPQGAALLLSLVSFSGIAGKLCFGAVADRIDKRLLLWAGMTTLAVFLLIALSQPGFAALAGGCIAMGFALGGALPLWGALIGDCFGSDAFGEVMGWMGPAMLPFTVSGVQLLPWCYDAFDSYAPGLQGCLVALAVASSLLLALRLPQRTAD